MRQLALGQHPAAEDENQQQQLLQRTHPVAVLYVRRVDVDVTLRVKSRSRSAQL